MDSRLINLLCCPVSKTSVRRLNAVELATLNQAITTGKVTMACGEAISHVFAEGLITCDGKYVYRIEDGIPVMLANERIDLTEAKSYSLT